MDANPFLEVFDPEAHGGHRRTGGTVFVPSQMLVTTPGKEAPILDPAGVGVVGQWVMLKAVIFGSHDPASPVVAAVDDLTIASNAGAVGDSNSTVGQKK